MICPGCKEEMIVVEYKQIELDICSFCKGIWFDAAELGLLLESIGLSTEGLVHPPEQKLAEEKRRCPYCRKKMQKALIGAGGDVVIDRCKRGHGLWFDGGELDTVIKRLRGPAEGAEATAKVGGEVGSFLADVLLAGDDNEQKGGEE